MDEFQKQMKEYNEIMKQNQDSINSVAKTISVPKDYLTQLIEISRKKGTYHWALSYEIVVLILFVFLCASSYMILIKGDYSGTAIHIVPEMNNISYEGYYTSNSEHSEVDSGSDVEVDHDEEPDLRNDPNLPSCPLNERL